MLARRYQEDTVLMSTQVVAHVLYRDLVQSTPGMDLFTRMRLRGEFAVDRETLHRELGEARDRLFALEGRGRFRTSEVVKEDSPEQLLERALGFWSGYHDSTAATREGDRIVIGDPSLLLYYQNRLVPFAEDLAGPEHLKAACEIEQLGAYR